MKLFIPIMLAACSASASGIEAPARLNDMLAEAPPAPVAAIAGAVSTNDLYVADTGNDNNPGTKSAPVKTLEKASKLATPGTTVHVAPGTYEGGFQTKSSGTASARIHYLSDAKWGAKIVPPAYSKNSVAWDNRGDYVDIDGFEVDGTNSQGGVPWVNGIITLASYNVIKNNHVHHFATNASCNSNGGSAINTSRYYNGVNVDVINNVVHHVGTTGCSLIQGIYIGTPGNVRNNLVYQIGYAGIHLWHDAANVTVTNNTVFGSGMGIIVGGGDYYNSSGPADYVRVTNNIVYDNTHGISEAGEIGANNAFANNLSFKNVNRNLHLYTAHTGDLTEDPQFEKYDRNGGGDYRLKSTSPALGRGYIPVVN